MLIDNLENNKLDDLIVDLIFYNCELNEDDYQEIIKYLNSSGIDLESFLDRLNECYVREKFSDVFFKYCLDIIKSYEYKYLIKDAKKYLEHHNVRTASEEIAICFAKVLYALRNYLSAKNKRFIKLSEFQDDFHEFIFSAYAKAINELYLDYNFMLKKKIVYGDDKNIYTNCIYNLYEKIFEAYFNQKNFDEYFNEFKELLNRGDAENSLNSPNYIESITDFSYKLYKINGCYGDYFYKKNFNYLKTHDAITEKTITDKNKDIKEVQEKIDQYKNNSKNTALAFEKLKDHKELENEDKYYSIKLFEYYALVSKSKLCVCAYTLNEHYKDKIDIIATEIYRDYYYLIDACDKNECDELIKYPIINKLLRILLNFTKNNSLLRNYKDTILNEYFEKYSKELIVLTFLKHLANNCLDMIDFDEYYNFLIQNQKLLDTYLEIENLEQNSQQAFRYNKIDNFKIKVVTAILINLDDREVHEFLIKDFKIEQAERDDFELKYLLYNQSELKLLINKDLYYQSTKLLIDNCLNYRFEIIAYSAYFDFYFRDLLSNLLLNQKRLELEKYEVQEDEELLDLIKEVVNECPDFENLEIEKRNFERYDNLHQAIALRYKYLQNENCDFNLFNDDYYLHVILEILIKLKLKNSLSAEEIKSLIKEIMLELLYFRKLESFDIACEKLADINQYLNKTRKEDVQAKENIVELKETSDLNVELKQLKNDYAVLKNNYKFAINENRDLKTELNKLHDEILDYKDEHNELVKIREQIFKMEQKQEIEDNDDEYSLELLKDYAKKYKIIFACENVNLNKHIKENVNEIDTIENIANRRSNLILNSDFVFISWQFISHSLYHDVLDIAKRSNSAKYYYVDGNNVTRIAKQMVETIRNNS